VIAIARNKEGFGFSISVIRKALACLFVMAVLTTLLPSATLAAITVEYLVGGSCGLGSSCTTTSFTPAPNALVLALVGNGATSGQTDRPGIPSVVGSSLSWEMVQSGAQTATVPYSTIGTPKLRVSLFKTMGGYSGAESLTLSFGADQKNCVYSIIQFKGIDVSGTNGSAAILQLVTTQADSTVGWGTTLGPLANSANASVGVWGINQTQSSNLAPGAGYTASAMVTAGNPNIALRYEWAMLPPSMTVNFTSNSSIDVGGFALEIKGGPTPVLGNGTDPPNASLAPGGAATMADSFTFQTPEGASAITALNVTLSAGSYTGVSKIEITDDSGSTVYGSINNPTGDLVTIPLPTNIIATTTISSYKIRITPKTHATMPAPQGTLYAVTAYVSNWAAGSDTGGTTVTIDNRSPDNATAPTTQWGDAQVTLGWTLPADSDLAGVVVLRKASSAVADLPVEGTSYSAGNTVGASTVGCVVAAPGVTCIDTGLTNNTPYYYKLFARDSSGNYSATGTAAGPVTPNRFQPDLLIRLLSETDADYTGGNTYQSSSTTQAKAEGARSGATATYKVRIQNGGTGPDSLVVTGTGNGSGFSAVYKDELGVDQTSAVTGAGYTIPTLAIGAYKDWTVTVTPSGGGTPVAGGTVYHVLVTGTSGSDATKIDQVKASTTSTSANITVSKTADKPSYKPGDDITYTIAASNGTNLSNATNVLLTEPIPATTSFKVNSALFNAGTSTLTSAISYSDKNGAAVTPESAGCQAPPGYDDCVRQIKWTMTGNMPPGTNFTCSVVVKVK
jgi:uncharacterized repeat protein (TIGR01451 family)